MSTPSNGWSRLVGNLGDQWSADGRLRIGADSRLRLSDDDREAAVRELGEHYATGRLTADEHEERTEQAWAAKTRADLAPLFRDLPISARGGPISAQGGEFLRPPATGPALRPSPRRGAIPTPIVVLLAVVAALALASVLPVLVVVLVLWWLVAGHARHRWGHRLDRRHHGHHGGPPWLRRTSHRPAR